VQLIGSAAAEYTVLISHVVCQTVKSIANRTKIHRKKHRKKVRESESETEEKAARKKKAKRASGPSSSL
jgi:hypothetical protein